MNSPSSPATLAKVSPPKLAWIDSADRPTALLNLARRAAAGSPVHWRRLRRLSQADKQALWAVLSPETRAVLKAQAASLDAALQPR